MKGMRGLLSVCFAGVCMSGFFFWLVTIYPVVALIANAVMWIGLIAWSNLWWARQ